LQDHRGNQLYLGINHCGILTFQGSRKTHHFRWVEVQKINYEGKMFIVHLTFNEVRNSRYSYCVPSGTLTAVSFMWMSLTETRRHGYKCRRK
jgi:hypothetical protein